MRHINRSIALLSLILMALMVGNANAQTSMPDVLTLAEANDRVLTRNLAIESARLQVTKAEAERVAAKLRPRPTITVSGENLGVTGPTQFSRLYEAGAVVTQPFEIGGQRKARKELAEKTVSLAEAQLTAVIRQRQTEMRRAFYDVLFAQALLGVEESNQTNFAELLRYNTVRLEEGEIAPGELLKVRLEKIKYDTSVAAARLALRQAKVRLVEILGETDFSRIDAIEARERFDLVDFPVSLSALKQLALENRPEIKAAEAEVERFGASTRLEKARGSGEIAPFTGYRRVGPDNTVLVGVTVPLPFGNRNQGEIARAEAEEKIARNALVQTRNRTLADIEAAHLAFETAREQARSFETGILTQADESLSITLLMYREGATELVNLLDAQRTRNEIRTGYYRSLLAYYQSLFQLELATGTEIRK